MAEKAREVFEEEAMRELELIAAQEKEAGTLQNLQMASEKADNDPEPEQWSPVTQADPDSEAEKMSEVTQEELEDEGANEVASSSVAGLRRIQAKARPRPSAQPKAMPSAIKVQHHYPRNVPEWVKEAENAAYMAYAKTPLIGHQAREEAWRWRARRTYVVPPASDPDGFPESESQQDRGCARTTRMILKKIREMAHDEQKAWQKKRQEQGKRRKRLSLLRKEVPDKVYVFLEKAFKALTICEEWFSNAMQLKLVREIFYTVAYVEDQYADPVFVRKAANKLGLTGIPIFDFRELAAPPKVGATSTASTLGQSRKRSRSRAGQRPKPKRPKIMVTRERVPVDDVEFSQDSIGVRFTCGRHIKTLVADLRAGDVNPENLIKYPFMKLLAVKIDDRIISRCNRRLWCLREVQRLKRDRDPNYVQHVWLEVKEFPDEVTKELVRKRLSQKPRWNASEIRVDENNSNIKDDFLSAIV